MTILTFPQDWYRVASGSFHLVSRNFMSTSPWTGRRGASGPNSQLWSVKITLAPQEHHRWMAMEGFFAELGGQSGRLWLSDFAKLRPQYDLDVSGVVVPWDDASYFDDGSGWVSGYLPPVIHVAEAAALGLTHLVVGGLPEDIVRVLRRGDLFEIRRDGVADGTPSLHMLVRDAHSNADGEAGLTFRPGLRKGVAAGDMVVLRRPQGIFRLVGDDQAEVTRTPPLIGELGFELIEALI
jgi:hypothetical protein